MKRVSINTVYLNFNSIVRMNEGAQYENDWKGNKKKRRRFFFPGTRDEITCTEQSVRLCEASVVYRYIYILWQERKKNLIDTPHPPLTLPPSKN